MSTSDFSALPPRLVIPASSLEAVGGSDTGVCFGAASGTVGGGATLGVGAFGAVSVALYNGAPVAVKELKTGAADKDAVGK